MRNSESITPRALARVARIDAEPLALLANEGAAVQPGTVYLANESVFTQQYFDEPLTNYRDWLAGSE